MAVGPYSVKRPESIIKSGVPACAQLFCPRPLGPGFCLCIRSSRLLVQSGELGEVVCFKVCCEV